MYLMQKLIIAAAFASVVGTGAATDRQVPGRGAADRAGGALASVTTLPAAATVPKAVVDVGTYGEDLYDEAKASNWAKATAYMDSLDASAKALKGGERARLMGTLDRLRGAVAAKRRDTALEAANRVTYLAAKISEPYKPATPVAVVMLDYYGRELEIWSSRRNTTKLVSTSSELRRTWESVKPTVVRAGGAAAAATTDSLVAKLRVAKTPADYATLAKPFLNVVDELEKPFEK
jgi:hypothetical protein